MGTRTILMADCKTAPRPFASFGDPSTFLAGFDPRAHGPSAELQVLAVPMVVLQSIPRALCNREPQLFSGAWCAFESLLPRGRSARKYHPPWSCEEDVHIRWCSELEEKC